MLLDKEPNLRPFNTLPNNFANFLPSFRVFSLREGWAKDIIYAKPFQNEDYGMTNFKDD